MDFKESLVSLGLEKVLASIYSNLSSIDFSKVVYNEQFDLNGFDVSKGEDNWYFAIGSMPLLYKVCNEENIVFYLNQLLIGNGISPESFYSSETLREVTFWNGSGFKVERVKSNDGNMLLIVTPEFGIEVDANIFIETNKAKVVDKPNWINGISPIYDETSIESSEKSLNNFALCPLLFQDGKESYILIPIIVHEYALSIINYIIEANGGIGAYETSEADGWENAYIGKLFAIGFQSELSSVRINRIVPEHLVEGEYLREGIHPCNDDIHRSIKGLNCQVLSEGEGNVSDGRLIGSGDLAPTIVGFNSVSEDFIVLYKTIVNEYNCEDDFLRLTNDSITEWLDRNQDETITFQVSNSFTAILSKGNTYYRINFIAANQSIGWSDSNRNNVDFDSKNVGKVLFSKPLEINQIKAPSKASSTHSTYAHVEKNVSEEKRDFITNSLEDKLNNSDLSKSSGSKWVRWLFIALGILFLLVLLRNCEFNPDSRYYYERGVDRYAEGKIEKAEKNFGKAIDLDNSYSEPFRSRGEMYLENERYQEALYDFDQLIRMDANDWYAYYLRGLTNMKLADSEYSNYNSLAIRDFTNSIELNATSVNGRSYYQRAAMYKKLGDDRSCSDFYIACGFEVYDACQITNEECRPLSGELPYEDIFGPGVYKGTASFIYTNNCAVDAVVTIKSLRTKRAIRSVYVRAGERYDIKKIPLGRYRIELLKGNKWVNSSTDRGRFLIDEKASKVNDIWVYTQRTGSWSMADCASGGDISSDEISTNEYFNR